MRKIVVLKERLESEGWWIGECDDMPMEGLDDLFPETHPHAGEEVNFCKVLWWNSEDVLIDPCVPEGLTKEEEKVWEESFEKEPIQYYAIEDIMLNGFCFNTDEKSIENLKGILPLIEECGCKWDWNKSGEQKKNLVHKMH